MSLVATMRIMACHESRPKKNVPCAGWLSNQLGQGNNLGLRLAVLAGRVSVDLVVEGDQHATLEETLP